MRGPASATSGSTGKAPAPRSAAKGRAGEGGEAREHLEGRFGDQHLVTGFEVGAKQAIERAIGTGGDRDACRLDAEPARQEVSQPIGGRVVAQQAGGAPGGTSRARCSSSAGSARAPSLPSRRTGGRLRPRIADRAGAGVGVSLPSASRHDLRRRGDDQVGAAGGADRRDQLRQGGARYRRLDRETGVAVERRHGRLPHARQ